ncbi:hypothetical protein DFJ43DRAFT_1006877 [Lentinula guzmanii]|uniref:Uncharacterized protein n=1 Tax=Lentinula guzmanii TaxID=2804957 RepID=A0AA38MW25_9AGAR|nr:hypothetical protein DFJ43DRAFT_1006877 [Lentinula guzmanii]KAJ3799091.1 hypothetical protein GGU11DRAFT_722166 [Lentinula aff. detonsa]
MFSTLDVEIRPGSGLGAFELGNVVLRIFPYSVIQDCVGASLWNIIHMLRQMQHLFPQVEIKYDPDTSSTTPIILHLRPHLDLLFSGKHQRLRTICVRRLRDTSPPVTLRYKDVVLSSADEVLRRVGTSRTFGPTYPGDDLRYPGVWFGFEEDGIGEGRKGAVYHEDRSQEVKRVLISQKEVDTEEGDALGEIAECPIMNGDIALAIAKVHDGVTLHFHPSTSTPVHVRIGTTTAQDLAVILGPPLHVHYKEDDRMTIHSSLHDESDTGYFYNYFQHGIDFYISGNTHTVQKIVLQSNVPGTPLFQVYKRCNWEIEGKPEDDEDDTPPRKRFYDRFETISHFLNPREPPPSMLLDRTNDEENITLPSPATRLYGYDGVILEVSEASQVLTITLF